jgi:hypothetical protein
MNLLATRRGLALCLIPLAALALACGPIGPMPGGRLSGEAEAQVPSDWSFTDAVDTVQLETGGSDPYSVNVWATSVDGQLMIAAGNGGESRWARNLEADPLVPLRADGRIYELRAVRGGLTPEVQDAFLTAIEKKYDFERDPDDPDDAWLYRMTGR